MSILVGLLIIALGVVVVTQNPEVHTVNLAILEITASVGVTWVAALGLGILTGVVAMLTRDVPRMRLLRTLDGDS